MNRSLQFFCVLTLLCHLPAAHAYIDPGSGGLVLQMLIAGGIALVYRVRGYLREMLARVRRWFGRP